MKRLVTIIVIALLGITAHGQILSTQTMPEYKVLCKFRLGTCYVSQYDEVADKLIAKSDDKSN